MPKELEAKKHVIILGAGASMTSGYPDANRLAILMCDRPIFLEKLHDVLRDDGEEHIEAFLRAHGIKQQYDSFAPAARTLRDGDFATMDELSNLAKGGLQAGQIRDLKKLMRFVFGLSQPHSHLWAASDYRKFIQSIFVGQSHLRSDISVISFNYDPYFEYRLAKALRSRTSVRPIPAEELDRMELAAASGFVDPSDLSWLDTPGFCHLKLHGTAALPLPKGVTSTNYPPKAGEPSQFTSAHLVGLRAMPRFACLSDAQFADQDPPALLPWEIISPEGTLLDEPSFTKIVGDEWQHRRLYPLFCSLWRRARLDIQEADKISFVGLSLGTFMEPELKYLFEGKNGAIQLVVANKDNEKIKDGVSFHRWSCTGKILAFLADTCSALACNRSTRDFRKRPDRSDPFYGISGSVTPRNDFADFIQNEL